MGRSSLPAPPAAMRPRRKGTSMNRNAFVGVAGSLLLVCSLAYGQGRGGQQAGPPPAPSYTPTVTPFEKLPDWSGAWSMMGGTVFDRASQTGQGGAVNAGVREHPPYTAEWEAIYAKSLEKRDKNLLPDTITNCGVPAGFPRMLNLPDPYEFVIRPEEFWILA